MMYAPRITGTAWTPAQNWLQHVRSVLKPTMSCSWPKTRMSFALRPAGVRGTCAHDWANGAAESAAERLAADGLPVAAAASASRLSAAPAAIMRRLAIDPSK